MTNIPFQPLGVPFEAVLETDGRLHLNNVPDDEQVLNQIVQAIVRSQPFGEAWASDYRTQFVLSGAAPSPVTTLEDVQAIAVPHWRRLRGELRGDELFLSEWATSTDGETWEAYPAGVDPAEESRHPAFALAGKALGQIMTLHWREGRIDLEPEPPEDVLELVEQVVAYFNGLDDAGWIARHEQFGGDPKHIPAAKRVTFELRELAPLFSPSEPPFVRQFGHEFWPMIPLEYSLDGKKWQAYQIADAPLPVLADADDDSDDGEDPFGLLSQLFDMQSVTVTVQAGGEVTWDEGEIPETYAEALRGHIIEATGAGQPEEWAERTGELLPEGVSGVPKAVRLQVMKALLDAGPSMLAQSFAPSALTIDGETWHDLTPDFLMDDEDEDE